MSSGWGGGTGSTSTVSSSDETTRVDTFTLSATDISNKYVVLSEAPTVKNYTRMSVAGGTSGFYGVDFEVTTDNSNRRLSWAGLGFDGVLFEGSEITIRYPVSVA